jgi:hypothetical protein
MFSNLSSHTVCWHNMIPTWACVKHGTNLVFKNMGHNDVQYCNYHLTCFQCTYLSKCQSNSYSTVGSVISADSLAWRIMTMDSSQTHLFINQINCCFINVATCFSFMLSHHQATEKIRTYRICLDPPPPPVAWQWLNIKAKHAVMFIKQSNLPY